MAGTYRRESLGTGAAGFHILNEHQSSGKAHQPRSHSIAGIKWGEKRQCQTTSTAPQWGLPVFHPKCGPTALGNPDHWGRVSFPECLTTAPRTYDMSSSALQPPSLLHLHNHLCSTRKTCNLQEQPQLWLPPPHQGPSFSLLRLCTSMGKSQG